MIKVLFFAHLKQTLGCESLDVEIDMSNVADLRRLLSKRGDVWASSIGSSNTLVAVNQSMANDESAIQSGDEVAFFPPVTGG